MSDLETAAQQALDVMSDISSFERWSEAKEALRAALAEPVQEPVAWYHVPHPGNGISPVVSMFQQREPSLYAVSVPLYTAPPQRKPLTEETMRECAQAMDAEPLAEGWHELIKFARAIERAHGIGGQDEP